SLPIDPEMFGTKAPRTSRDGQHPTFQTVPPRPPLPLFSSWIARLVCSICHTRRADTRGRRPRVSPGHASGHLLQHAEKKRIFVIVITAQARRPSYPRVVDRCRVCGSQSRCSSELSPANAGLLCVWGAFRKTWVPIHPMVGGCVGIAGGWFMNKVLSLQLARKRAWQPRCGSSGHAFKR